jgi:tetratricopeptide (TPR) repeat protein
MKFLVAVAIAALVLAGCSHTQRAARHERKGTQLFAKKDYAHAVLEFKTAAQLAPRNPELWFQLGLTCLELKDAACAAQALRNATEIDPNRTGAQIQLAALYAASGQQELLLDGEKRIRHVLDFSPGNALAWQTFSAIEIRLNKAKGAVAALDTAARNLPGNVTVSGALAQARYFAGDSAGAGQILQQAARANPKSLEAALALAQFDLATGFEDEAESELRRALRIDAKNAGALAMLAESASRRGRLAEAESLYRQLASADPQYKAAYASLLLRQGKLDAALAELERLAHDNPADREIRGTLVATYIQLGRTGEAEHIVENALRKNAHDADALLQRGELRLRAGRLPDAEHDFSQVIGFEPRSANAYYDLSLVEHRRANPILQRNDLGRALEINPDLLEARIALAQNFLVAGNPRSALDLMDSAPEAQKTPLASVVTRNSALLSLGRLDEARKSIEQALRNSSAPELLLQKAQLEMDSKDYASARAALNSFLKQSPDNEQALNLLVQTYASQGRMQAGVEALEPYASRSSRAREVLATWLTRSGKNGEARAALESAVTQEPDRYEAKIRLAQLDLQEGKSQDAKNDMEKLIGAHPESVPARLVLAHAAEVAGDSQTEVQQYRSVLDLDQNNLEALNNLAYLLAREKSSDATAYAEKALAIAPDRAAVLDTAAFAFYRQGMYRQAVADLEKAEMTEPTPRHQYHLAIAYLAMGDIEKGRSLLNTAVTRDPHLIDSERDWPIPASHRQ